MIYLIFALLIANLTSWSIIGNVLSLNDEIAFLDVGQGAAVLMKNRSSTMLYDAGPPGVKTVQEIEKILPFYDRTIDLLILSHPDKDHFGGAQELLQRSSVRLVVVNGQHPNESEWRHLMQEVKDRNIPVIALASGDTIRNGNQHINILHPAKDFFFPDDNQNSLVLKVSQNQKTFLLTGDIDELIEYQLASSGTLLDAEYAQIPHHGSKYSSSADFLKTVSPRLAVIQTGRNRYGHPHKEVLERLSRLGIKYHRTDLQGALRVPTLDTHANKSIY